jgi:hypothetical protein
VTILRLVLAAALGLAATSSASATAAPLRTTGMYDDRYCEYLVVKGTLPNLTGDIWNTYGLNACPDKLWKASDANLLATDLGVLAVRLNGPRHWLMDRSTVTLAAGFGQVRSFHGLRMRRIVALQVPLVNGVPGQLPYAETTVNRRNTFTFSRAHRVYELVAPGGKVYVMQSYAQIIDPGLTLAKLPGLGTRLKLPAGWRYRVRRLTQDLAVTATGRATVVQDELSNTYQLEQRG